MNYAEILSYIRGHLASEAVEARSYPKDPRYYLTDCGNVFRIFKNSVKHLKTSLNSGGYPTFARSQYLHRAVCLTFNGEAPEGSNVVRHLDGNKLNARADNLVWGTQSENMYDFQKHQREAGVDQALLGVIERLTALGADINDIALLAKMPVKKIEAIRGWCSVRVAPASND